MEQVALAIALIAVSGVAAQWIAWRYHFPAIVVLLLTGFFMGPVTGILEPQHIFGELMTPLVSIAVAIILFEGGLNLKFAELRETRDAVRRVIVFGAFIGWVLISLGAHYVAGLSWPVAVTFGGILIVTGPTVIIPMLRQARLDPRAGSILKWEGIVNDPVGALLAVLSFEYFLLMDTPDGNPKSFMLHVVLMLGAISLVSWGLGLLVRSVLERGHVPVFLKTPFILALVIFTFVLANMVQHESGLVAVTILGMTLANIRLKSIEDIRRFKESVTIMLVSGVFILLTASLDMEVLSQMDFRGILFIVVLMLVIRPVTVFLASLGSQMSWQERVLVGWIAPRGVVCVAISGLFGPLLVKAGYPDGGQIVPIAFGVVLATVLAHGLTLPRLGERLGLVSRETEGLIIVGVNPWTTQLAEALMSRGVPVLISDTRWDHLEPARLAGIPVYYGQILSEETEFELPLHNYGMLLSATENPAYNALVCNHFAHVFGRDNIYELSDPDEEDKANKKTITPILRGRPFISGEMGLFDIWTRFADGWRFTMTRISDDFTMNDLHAKHDEQAIAVGMLTDKAKLRFLGPESTARPKSGNLVLMFGPQPRKVAAESGDDVQPVAHKLQATDKAHKRAQRRAAIKDAVKATVKRARAKKNNDRRDKKD